MQVPFPAKAILKTPKVIKLKISKSLLKLHPIYLVLIRN